MRFVLAVTFLLSASSVRADNANEAREHYERGTTFYDIGKFGDAAHEYEQAYQLKNDPALLFNIGQAYRLGGDNVNALRAYRSFLRRVPDTSNRAEVTGHIANLQKLVDEQRKASPATAAPSGGVPRESSPKPAMTTPPPTSANSVPAIGPSPAELRAASARSAKVPLYKKWWLWTIVGVGVAGAAVATAVALTTPNNAALPSGGYNVSF